MRSTIKKENSGSILGTTILIAVAIILSLNILRVVVNGRNNYDTFIEEQKSLARIQERNKELAEEKQYVVSEEYKLILLRDAARLAQGGETLYQIKSSPVYLDEEVVLLDITAKTNFFDWWVKLVF